MDIFGSWTCPLSPTTTCAGKPRGGHKALWVPGMTMPRVPPDRKEMVQGASYGSSEASKDEGVGNHEGVQVGGDASVQAEEQEWWDFEPGVMVMSIVAGGR